MSGFQPNWSSDRLKNVAVINPKSLVRSPGDALTVMIVSNVPKLVLRLKDFMDRL